MGGILSTLANAGLGSITGGLASALGSIPGAIMQNEFNKAAEQRNFNYTKQLNEQMFNYQQELQKQQNDFNLDMWNKANEYNSASAQVQRLRDAGLNVGLSMSGQSSAISPTISSANPSTPNSADGSFAQAPNTVGIMSSVVNRDLTMKQLELQKLKIDNDFKIEDRKTKALEEKTKSDVNLNEILGEKLTAEKGYTEEKTKEVTQNIINLQKSVETMDAQLNLYNAQQDYYKAQADKAREERNYIAYNAITNRIKANSDKLVSEATAELYKHYGEKADSEAEMNNQQCKNLVGQLQNITKDGQLKDIELKYKGDMYKANIKLVNGQVTDIKIRNAKNVLTFAPDVASAYADAVKKAADATSSCAGAFVDVASGGVTTVLK